MPSCAHARDRSTHNTQEYVHELRCARNIRLPRTLVGDLCPPPTLAGRQRTLMSSRSSVSTQTSLVGAGCSSGPALGILPDAAALAPHAAVHAASTRSSRAAGLTMKIFRLSLGRIADDQLVPCSGSALVDLCQAPRDSKQGAACNRADDAADGAGCRHGGATEPLFADDDSCPCPLGCSSG